MLPAYAGMIPRPKTISPPTTGAPRVCGDDPGNLQELAIGDAVLPAYAGMIRLAVKSGDREFQCSPRMRG